MTREYDNVPVLTVSQEVIACEPQKEITDFDFIVEPKGLFVSYNLEVCMTAGIADEKRAEITRLADFISPQASNADCRAALLLSESRAPVLRSLVTEYLSEYPLYTAHHNESCPTPYASVFFMISINVLLPASCPTWSVPLHEKRAVLAPYGQYRLRNHTQLPVVGTELYVRKVPKAAKAVFLIGPLAYVGMDILGPLPKAKQDNKFIVLMTGRCTKLTRALPATERNATTVAAIILERWVSTYGITSKHFTNDAPNFV